jgi:hypothetical protein
MGSRSVSGGGSPPAAPPVVVPRAALAEYPVVGQAESRDRRREEQNISVGT